LNDPQHPKHHITQLPCDKLFELPGRPNVLYTIKNYSYDKTQGAAECRQEAGFMFRAFETGQIGPRRLARMLGENAPRNATIHEYLDWTCTAHESQDDTEYDFSGFRIVLLYPRERNMWPAPAGAQGSQPQPRADARLGAPLDPWPGLQIKGRPLSAATIRSGPGYLEVPFVATHENKRGRGFGRCLVEAIEEVSRALGIGRLLLCSTCEEHVQSTWKHLGFTETTDADLEALDVGDPDLVHMQVCVGVWERGCLLTVSCTWGFGGVEVPLCLVAQKQGRTTAAAAAQSRVRFHCTHPNSANRCQTEHRPNAQARPSAPPLAPNNHQARGLHGAHLLPPRPRGGKRDPLQARELRGGHDCQPRR